MRQQLALIVAGCLLLSACGASETAQNQQQAGAESQSSVAAPSELPATEGGTAMPSKPPKPSPTLTSQPAPGLGQALSLQQTEALIIADLAGFLKLPQDQIQMVSTERRTWPDQGLGCSKRAGVYEPAPVPGYRVVLSDGANTFTYHADQHGRFLRCREGDRRIGPMLGR